MKKRNKLFVRLTAAILIICTLCSIASAADLTSAVKDSLPVEISVENSVASFTLKNSGSEYYKYSVEVMDSDKETYLLCNNFEPNETAMVSGISAGLNYPLHLELYNPENVYFYEGSYSVYNTANNRIYISDPSNLTLYEKYAILMTHTANVTFNSFAAEVEYHADKLIDKLYIAFYERAIRADMAIGEDNESGVSEIYYDLNNEIVRQQIQHHGEY